MTDTIQQRTRSVTPPHADIPFRIRIGVTGHRTLPNEKALSEKVRQVLTEFKEVIESLKAGKIPESANHPLGNALYELFDEDSRKAIRSSPRTPVAFSILTPLAEGADRLVAKEVLNLKKTNILKDPRIEVVLPLAKDDYLEDFETETSKHEFRELLKEARRPITLKKYLLKEEYGNEDLAEARRQAYKAVGQYVVNHCNILIALWDGDTARGMGGTAEIVDYAKKRNRLRIIVSTKYPYEVTIQTEGVEGTDGSITMRSIERIEKFNTYPIPEDTLRKYLDNLHRELFNQKDGGTFPEETRNLVEKDILPYYVRASLIAKWYQRLYLRAGTFAYTLAAIAIAAVAIGIMSFRLSPYAYLLEFLFLITIFLLITYANRKKVHRKWIENRFLAERIRSAQFFVLCGVEISAIEIPPYMGAAHQSDDWMIRVFHEIWNKLPLLKGSNTINLQQLSEYIHNHWLDDQIKYHKEKKTSTGRKSKLFERIGFALFLVAMIVAFAHAIAHFRVHEPHHSILNNTLTFFAIVLPVVGAVIGSIRAHREYSRLEKRSLNMETVLMDIKERYSQTGSQQELESLLRETDELMLRETQDWLMLMKFVELKPEA